MEKTMSLLTIANQKFQLPDGLQFRELGYHPRNTYALTRADRISGDNPLGVIDSVDVRRDKHHEDLFKLLAKHGAKPASTLS